MSIKRGKGESFESMMRRFSKTFKLSGKMPEVKRRQAYDTKKRVTSKTRRKKSALKRIETAASIAYLKKIGRLQDEMIKHRK